jgi:peptidoglycan/LPS O-acetylase OafA/YrhL
VFWLSFIARLLLSRRRTSIERRQQLKWLLTGCAITLASGVLSITPVPAAFQSTVDFLSDLGFVALPVCVGIAILRYRLYDIDRIISRALAYAIVTGLLIGLYAALVLLATRGLSFRTPVAVAASTLTAAALFNPLRQRVQRIVDRRFNRARYDADQIVAAFAARLKDTVNLHSVQDDLATVVDQALEPARVFVWTNERE